jgi:hypothetical protein
MAGKMAYKTYVGDNAKSYAIYRDKSNSEATLSSNGNAVLLTAFAAGSDFVPRNLNPRYVWATLATDATQRRKFVVGSLAAFNSIISGATITEPGAGGGVWNVTGKFGERLRIPKA